MKKQEEMGKAKDISDGWSTGLQTCSSPVVVPAKKVAWADESHFLYMAWMVLGVCAWVTCGRRR